MKKIDELNGLMNTSIEAIENKLGTSSSCKIIGEFNAYSDWYYEYSWNTKEYIIKLAFDKNKKLIKVLEVTTQKKATFLKDLRNPMFLTLFAGLVTIGVGYFWEYFKFKRQTVFEKRINLILDSRKQVQDTYIEFDRIIRQTRAYEKAFRQQNSCDPQNLSSQLEEIKLLSLKVAYIKEFSKGIIENPELASNIDLFIAENKHYINCIQKNTNCEICTDQYPSQLTYLNKVIELHTQEINMQIK